ncbi:hypothetical protein [Paenibacillus sp. FJAT-26967]|nr:hypothetical protein [Paenibacillus sp. FJAT-26967]
MTRNDSNNSKAQDIQEKENKNGKSEADPTGTHDKKLNGPNFPAT